jgi:hypothetical protein
MSFYNVSRNDRTTVSINKRGDELSKIEKGNELIGNLSTRKRFWIRRMIMALRI